MDRPTTRTEADARGPRPEQGEGPLLPSRLPALDLCRLALGGERPTPGPVLLTGEAGAGKTWVWRRAEAESPPGLRWVAVDLTPSNDPADFYRLIGHELGLDGPTSTAGSRVDLVDLLAGRQADGERVALVVEEAHNLSAGLWEEVRVLANRLDKPGGFAAIILAGQTSLAVRFSTRPFAAIEARLAARVHLGPVGVDEAKALLARLRPGRDWADSEVELLHRDASGNPRRLLRMADRLAPARPAAIGRVAEVEPVGPSMGTSMVAERPAPVVGPMPLTGPVRPPIRADENMIEVGWSPEDASPPVPSGDDSPRKAGRSAASEGADEAVSDHYAALQAWREWTENQARRAPLAASADDEEEGDVEPEDDSPTTPPPPRPDRPTVRAEGEQKFAPFGHLFSRMAQAIEPE